MADTETLQGAVVIRVQRESALAVRDRLLKLTRLPQNGSTAIPAFRKLRMLRRDLVENAKRLFEILSIRRLTRLLHHPIDLAAGCGKPEMLQATLCHGINVGVLGLQPFEQLSFSTNQRKLGRRSETGIRVTTEKLLIEMILIPRRETGKMNGEKTNT